MPNQCKHPTFIWSAVYWSWDYKVPNASILNSSGIFSPIFLLWTENSSKAFFKVPTIYKKFKSKPKKWFQHLTQGYKCTLIVRVWLIKSSDLKVFLPQSSSSEWSLQSDSPSHTQSCGMQTSLLPSSHLWKSGLQYLSAEMQEISFMQKTYNTVLINFEQYHAVMTNYFNSQINEKAEKTYNATLSWHGDIHTIHLTWTN